MNLEPAGTPTNLNRPAESVVADSVVPEMNIDAPRRYPPRMLSTAAPERIAPERLALGLLCAKAVSLHNAITPNARNAFTGIMRCRTATAVMCFAGVDLIQPRSASSGERAVRAHRHSIPSLRHRHSRAK